ncbi:hypothetical protein E2562_037310, partial [Oryza meyeriana var. granulata]
MARWFREMGPHRGRKETRGQLVAEQWASYRLVDFIMELEERLTKWAHRLIIICSAMILRKLRRTARFGRRLKLRST